MPWLLIVPPGGGAQLSNQSSAGAAGAEGEGAPHLGLRRADELAAPPVGALRRLEAGRGQRVAELERRASDAGGGGGAAREGDGLAVLAGGQQLSPPPRCWQTRRQLLPPATSTQSPEAQSASSSQTTPPGRRCPPAGRHSSGNVQQRAPPRAGGGREGADSSPGQPSSRPSKRQPEVAARSGQPSLPPPPPCPPPSAVRAGAGRPGGDGVGARGEGEGESEQDWETRHRGSWEGPRAAYPGVRRHGPEPGGGRGRGGGARSPAALRHARCFVLRWARHPGPRRPIRRRRRSRCPGTEQHPEGQRDVPQRSTPEGQRDVPAGDRREDDLRDGPRRRAAARAGAGRRRAAGHALPSPSGRSSSCPTGSCAASTTAATSWSPCARGGAGSGGSCASVRSTGRGWSKGRAFARPTSRWRCGSSSAPRGTSSSTGSIWRSAGCARTGRWSARFDVS